MWMEFLSSQLESRDVCWIPYQLLLEKEFLLLLAPSYVKQDCCTKSNNHSCHTNSNSHLLASCEAIVWLCTAFWQKMYFMYCKIIMNKLIKESGQIYSKCGSVCVDGLLSEVTLWNLSNCNQLRTYILNTMWILKPGISSLSFGPKLILFRTRKKHTS